MPFSTDPYPGAPPPGTRLYVVGDIHGYPDHLARLHELILEDAATAGAARNVVVYVGDYVDRGPDSRRVIETLLRSPLPGFESVHLMGNHEAAMLSFLDEEELQMDWLGFGGAQTLGSYGVSSPRRFVEFREAREELARKLPPDHSAFLRGLALSHTEGDFFIVHAGVRPGAPLSAQVEDDLLWIREPFLSSRETFGKIVVHGHTIDRQPQVRSNRIGVDTGIYRYGRLTCAVMEGGRLGFLRVLIRLQYPTASPAGRRLSFAP
ncbi:MAG TPA: metallophosphoesterase [Stellaceae bacterium]|nr:metallophosphoesterase [Stellaceae bacterium]